MPFEALDRPMKNHRELKKSITSCGFSGMEMCLPQSYWRSGQRNLGEIRTGVDRREARLSVNRLRVLRQRQIRNQNGRKMLSGVDIRFFALGIAGAVHQPLLSSCQVPK